MAPAGRSNSWRGGKDQRRTYCTFKVAVYTGVFAFTCFFLAFFELGRNGYLTGSKGIGQQFASMSWLQTPEQEGETVSGQLVVPGRSDTTQVDDDDDDAESTQGVPGEPNSPSKQEEIASNAQREELQINSHTKHDTNTSLGGGSLEREEQTRTEPAGRLEEEKDSDGGSAALIVPTSGNSTKNPLELETDELKHEHEGATVDKVVVEGKKSSSYREIICENAHLVRMNTDRSINQSILFGIVSSRLGCLNPRP